MPDVARSRKSKAVIVVCVFTVVFGAVLSAQQSLTDRQRIEQAEALLAPLSARLGGTALTNLKNILTRLQTLQGQLPPDPGPSPLVFVTQADFDAAIAAINARLAKLEAGTPQPQPEPQPDPEPPPPPPAEVCGDGIDNDKDGQIDEDCAKPQPEPNDPSAPVIAWSSPASSPHTTTTTDTYSTIAFTCTDDVACASARWENPLVGTNTGTPNEYQCRVPSGDTPTKAISCTIRLAPLGQVNTVAVHACDAAGNCTRATREIIRTLPLEWVSAHLPDAVTNTPYGNGGWPLKCAQGTAPYTYAVVDGTLPSGFDLDSRTGLLRGAHDGAGTFTFTVRCTDSRSTPSVASRAFQLVVGAAPVEGSHDYFTVLSARSDVFKALSLRDSAQVAAHRSSPSGNKGVSALDYAYATDTDPRKQDAARFLAPEGQASPNGQQLRIPIGPSRGKNVLITYDMWWGAEWTWAHSRIQDLKGTPMHVFASGVANAGLWIGARVNFINAARAVATQPPGGPFAAFTFAQVAGKSGYVKPPESWCCRMAGMPNENGYLPTNVPTSQARAYPEAIQPFDESVVAGGQELGIVGDRWTRVWFFMERDASKDWVSSDSLTSGVPMAAYKWTMWMADTKREPMRFMNEGIVGIPASSSDHMTEIRVEWAPGNSAMDSLYAGRGPLVGYVRNLVVLHGTSKADVLTLLKKPVQ